MTVHGQSTCDRSPDDVNVFLSYAHEDKALLGELRKHLSPLRKSLLVVDWSDRLIEPGRQWQAEIQSAIDRAHIILLLVSPAFFDSEYCDLESRLALGRYEQRQATVIPILLRPVVWQDSIFASLQALPSDGKPVTDWPSQDSAFCDIAANIRELILRDHVTRKRTTLSRNPVASKERFLDAAISPLATISESTDLVAMIRLSHSEGLRAVLRIDKNYAIGEQQVVSQEFEIDFPGKAGASHGKDLELLVEAPTFDPPHKTKTIRVPPGGDSSPCVFLMTPRKQGHQQLTLEVLDSGRTIASRAFRVEVVQRGSDQLSYDLLTVPLSSSGRAGDEDTTEQRERTSNGLSFNVSVIVRTPDGPASVLQARLQIGGPSKELTISGLNGLTPGQRIEVVAEGRHTKALIGEAITKDTELPAYTLVEGDRQSVRSEIRLMTNLSATVHFADSKSGIRANIVDLSSNGVALEFERKIEPGTKLGIELDQAFARGEVRHCHETDTHAYISGIKVDKFIPRPQEAAESDKSRGEAERSGVGGDAAKDEVTSQPLSKSNMSGKKAAALAELARAKEEFAKGTIGAADRILPQLERFERIVEELD